MDENNWTELITYSLWTNKAPTCFIAVTVMTKKSGSPLVTGLVGVSIINCKTKNITQFYRTAIEK